MKADNLADHERRVHGSGRASAQARRRTVRRAAVVAGVLLAAVLVAFLVLRAGEPTPVDLATDGEPSWGDADAPVTVFLFADYQCPVCARYETQGALDRFLAQWVEPGHVQLVFKDLAFIGADSVVAAEASQVVWAMAPDGWAEWNRGIYNSQGAERSGWANRDGIVALTAQWGGVDMTEFTARLDAHEFRAEVEADIEEARDAGVNATPTIVVGAKRMNALDEAAVDAAVEAALTAAGAA